MPALNVTESNAVASAKKSGSPHEREVCRKSQTVASFFFDKNRWRLVGYEAAFFGARVNHATPFQSPGE